MLKQGIVFGALILCVSCNPQSASNEQSDVPPSKGWKFAGMDDDIDNYPTQIFCTESGDFDVMSDAGRGARLCIDYVPGLKRYAFPQVTYYARPEKAELDIVGNKSSLKVQLLRSGFADNVKWRTPMWKVYIRQPTAKVFAKFLNDQTEININGAKLNVTGHPWLK